VAGCHTGQLADPNDPAEAGENAVHVMRRELQGASDMLNERAASNEIDQKQYKAIIKEAAADLLNRYHLREIPASEAWEYVEILRTAERWEEAEKYARIAVEEAKRTNNPDRLVNDALRLAQAQAALKKVDDGIATARTVFNAKSTETAPILPATLYEFVPTARGQGNDAELAKLLEDAIACHMRTIVDPNSDAGRDFLMARPAHVRNAWREVIDLYQSAGRADLAQAAAKRAQAMMDQFGRT